MVWVLAGNPSINFYEKLGGRQSTTKQIQFGEGYFKAIAIGWTDINFSLQAPLQSPSLVEIRFLFSDTVTTDKSRKLHPYIC